MERCLKESFADKNTGVEVACGVSSLSHSNNLFASHYMLIELDTFRSKKPVVRRRSENKPQCYKIWLICSAQILEYAWHWLDNFAVRLP